MNQITNILAISSETWVELKPNPIADNTIIVICHHGKEYLLVTIWDMLPVDILKNREYLNHLKELLLSIIITRKFI